MEIEKLEDCVKFTIKNKKGEVFISFVDLEDEHFLYEHFWYIKKSKSAKKYHYYVATKSKGFSCCLHTLILGNIIKTVDHIDRNTLNNRKSNLRIADMTQQVFNTTPRNEVKGVYRKRKGFKAEIKFYNKRLQSKQFNTFEEACYMRELFESLIPEMLIVNPKLKEYSQKITQEQKKSIKQYFNFRWKHL